MGATNSGCRDDRWLGWPGPVCRGQGKGQNVKRSGSMRLASRLAIAATVAGALCAAGLGSAAAAGNKKTLARGPKGPNSALWLPGKGGARKGRGELGFGV